MGANFKKIQISGASACITGRGLTSQCENEWNREIEFVFFYHSKPHPKLYNFLFKSYDVVDVERKKFINVASFSLLGKLNI